jgi:hypothetical protein
MMAAHYGLPANSPGAVEVCNDAFRKLAQAAEFDEEKQALDKRRDYFHRLYEAYARRYESDFDRWEILGVECRFITVLGDSCPTCDGSYSEGMIRGTTLLVNCPTCDDHVDYLVGQADLVVRENGVVRVVDHKTTRKSVSEWKLSSYNEDPQFTHYLYGVSRTRGEEVGHACANVVAKLVNVDERGNPFHRNDEIVRGQVDFDTFVVERRERIREIRDRQARWAQGAETSPGTWPRTPSSCRQFGLCSMYGLCWPTRPDWWTVPEDLTESFEQKPLNYVDDYSMLIEEDIR